MSRAVTLATVKPKLTPNPKSTPTTPSAGETETKPAITFRISIILLSLEQWSLNAGDRFLPAGAPSLWHDVSEVPPRLKPFTGEPPPMPETSEWEAEQEAVIASFSSLTNDSIEQELLRQQNEATIDARCAQCHLADAGATR